MADKFVIAMLMRALLETVDVLDQGDEYQGEVLEVVASVKEALEAGRAYLGGAR